MYDKDLFTAIDPRYNSYLYILFMLEKFKVIDLGHRLHSFTMIALSTSEVRPKPHWLANDAVRAGTISYTEIVPVPRKKA